MGYTYAKKKKKKRVGGAGVAGQDGDCPLQAGGLREKQGRVYHLAYTYMPTHQSPRKKKHFFSIIQH